MKYIKLRIRTYGKQKIRGMSLYKVGGVWGRRSSRERGPMPTKNVELLEGIGWVVKHRTHSYTYMQAPEGEGTKRPIVTVTVPDDAEILALASELHAKGQSWRGELYGWPASYTPERSGVREATVIKWDGTSHDERRPYTDPASFEVGEDSWSVFIAWDNEGKNPMRWVRHDDNIVED